MSVLRALLAASLCGCSGALYTQHDQRSGQPAGGELLGATLAAREPGAGLLKAEVLATLGPPGEVLPLAGGDVFVYRRRLADTDVLNLNTSIITGIIVPLYARIDGRRRDEVLFIQFDQAGRVVAVSAGRP